jgi:uncharacterized membrane protein YphA (DoxX/SURF4 family)
MNNRIVRSNLGLWIYGCAAVATGIVNLEWGDFEQAHQPIQAFGDHIPGRILFAYIMTVCLIVAGAGILWHRTSKIAAAILAIIHLIFAAFFLPRLYTAPQVLGYHFAVYIGMLVGMCQQLILMAAAIVVFATTGSSKQKKSLLAAARFIFGICLIDFGLAHLTAIRASAMFVPQWLPFNASFWVVLTGSCFLLAGILILTGIMDAAASRSLGLMLLLFSILVLAPMPFASPQDQVAWGSNAYNLEAVGAAWIFASWFGGRMGRKIYQSV